MEKYIWIKVDTNDGDYAEELNQITEEKLKKILPVIEAINENNGEYACGELGDSGKRLYGDLEGYEDFDYLCPRGEYGFHTIENIVIYNIESFEELL